MLRREPPPQVVHVVHPRLTLGLAGGGKFDRRSRRNAPAAIVARPATPIRAGPDAGTLAEPPFQRRGERRPCTLRAPTNPAVIRCGSVASLAASPLMCSCRTWYSSCRRWASSQAAVNATGPRTPHSSPETSAPRHPDIVEALQVQPCAHAATRGPVRPTDRADRHTRMVPGRRGHRPRADPTDGTGPARGEPSWRLRRSRPPAGHGPATGPLRRDGLALPDPPPPAAARAGRSDPRPSRSGCRGKRSGAAPERRRVRSVLRPAARWWRDRDLPRRAGERRATPPPGPNRRGADRARGARTGSDGYSGSCRLG